MVIGMNKPKTEQQKGEKMMVKKWLIFGVGIVLGMGLVLNGAMAAENAPYKVGAVFSVTGGGSFLGDPEKKDSGNDRRRNQQKRRHQRPPA